MARWGRAARLVTLAPGARVLDVGCAFGHGTAILARRYRVAGHDLSSEYIQRARARLPEVPFTCGSAEALPHLSGSFDGAVLLDVLEHVPDERRVISEIARVVRPGGELIVSVPNRGMLAAWDSLNVYRRLFGDTSPAPTDDPSWVIRPGHRHYSHHDVERLLEPWFGVESVQLTGIGVAEVINLVLLILVLRFGRAPRLYRALRYLYFGAYIVEDELSIGRGSYHLMVRCRRRYPS